MCTEDRLIGRTKQGHATADPLRQEYYYIYYYSYREVMVIIMHYSISRGHDYHDTLFCTTRSWSLQCITLHYEVMVITIHYYVPSGHGNYTLHYQVMVITLHHHVLRYSAPRDHGYYYALLYTIRLWSLLCVTLHH